MAKRVAVVGAGAAGLVTGKFLRGTGMIIDIFERAPMLGGIWRYEQPENTNRVLYRGLRTNLPKEIMQYFTLPFDNSLPSFLNSDDMLGYLESYATEYQLHDMIQFNRTITSISPSFSEETSNLGASDNQPKHWVVKHADTQSLKSFTGDNLEGVGAMCPTIVAEYDYVVVANGHYDKPNIPSELELCPGFSSFPNEVMHSHDYDEPSIFKDKTVLLIGSGASGADLAREISEVGGKSIIVVDRHHLHSSTVSNYSTASCDGLAYPMIEVGGEFNNVFLCQSIDKITSDGFVHLKAMIPSDNGQVEQFKIYTDAILLCTGYEYDFPFLDNHAQNGQSLISNQSRRVHPLYLQLLHAKYPSLAFVGIPYLVVPFPFFEVQARFLAALYGHNLSPSDLLPSVEERMAWLEALYEKRGSVRKTHRLGEFQWEYCHEMLTLTQEIEEGVATAREAEVGGHGEKDLELSYKQLHDCVDLNRAIYEHVKRPSFPGDPDTYRSNVYTIDRDTKTWTVKP